MLRKDHGGEYQTGGQSPSPKRRAPFDQYYSATQETECKESTRTRSHHPPAAGKVAAIAADKSRKTRTRIHGTAESYLAQSTTPPKRRRARNPRSKATVRLHSQCRRPARGRRRQGSIEADTVADRHSSSAGRRQRDHGSTGTPDREGCLQATPRPWGK